MTIEYSPVILFAYERPSHTARVLSALSLNPESSKTDLIIFIDGAKTTDARARTEEVNALATNVAGFKTITVHRSLLNLGLSRSIIQGVTKVLETYDSVIVLEDDILVTPFFLKYMNDALSLYADEHKVASIHSYVYPVTAQLPETFFIKGANCWGWGTWKRAWETFNQDGSLLLENLHQTGKANSFDFDGTGPYLKMLNDQINGRNDSWAVRWHASTYLEDMYTLYPGISLVQNIGFDGSGFHSNLTNHLDVKVANRAINTELITIEESLIARDAFKSFFRDQKRYMHYPLPKRLMIRAGKPFMTHLPKTFQVFLKGFFTS